MILLLSAVQYTLKNTEGSRILRKESGYTEKNWIIYLWYTEEEEIKVGKRNFPLNCLKLL